MIAAAGPSCAAVQDGMYNGFLGKRKTFVVPEPARNPPEILPCARVLLLAGWRSLPAGTGGCHGGKRRVNLLFAKAARVAEWQTLRT